MTATIDSAVPAERDISGPLRRRNFGRNHAYYFGDIKVPGVTSVIGMLDKPALKGWAAGVAAEFVADAIIVKDDQLIADDLWAELVQQSKSWKYPLPAKFSRTKLVDALKWMHSRRSTEAAAKGTEVHDFAERLAAGEEVTVPDHVVGHVDAYLRFRDEWGPTDELTELSVGFRRFGGYAGTLDMICDVAGLGRCLIDIKTGSGVWGETALQLAAYRFADIYIDADGAEQPMPAIDWCGVLHLRADGYDLYPFVADADVHRQFLYLLAAYQRCHPLGYREDAPAGHLSTLKLDAITPEQVR